MKSASFSALLLAIEVVMGPATGASFPKVGPNYQPPKAAVPDSYHQPADGVGTNAGTAVGDWWTTLGDPELTALIDRAVKANLDLKVASSRVLEARAARRVTRRGPAAICCVQRQHPACARRRHLRPVQCEQRGFGWFEPADAVRVEASISSDSTQVGRSTFSGDAVGLWKARPQMSRRSMRRAETRL